MDKANKVYCVPNTIVGSFSLFSETTQEKTLCKVEFKTSIDQGGGGLETSSTEKKDPVDPIQLQSYPPSHSPGVSNQHKRITMFQAPIAEEEE
jgi:hypothetical protein